MVKGVADEFLVTADSAGYDNKLRDARVRRPGQPTGQQTTAVAALDPEDFAELLFEQIRPIQCGVGSRDCGQAGALLAGQIGRVLTGRLHRVSVADAGAGHGAHPHLVEGLECPGHYVERVQADHRLGGPVAQHGVDPFRAIAADVSQRSGTVGAELVEEPGQGVLVAGTSRPVVWSTTRVK